MGAEERVYTVEEADAMLPELQETLERMREARRVIVRSGERVRGAIAGNGGGSEGREHMDALSTLRAGVENLSDRGIVVRDVEAGLLDFPCLRDGRPAFLCWRLGEEHVGFWHPPDTGFAGRRPLENE